MKRKNLLSNSSSISKRRGRGILFASSMKRKQFVFGRVFRGMVVS